MSHPFLFAASFSNFFNTKMLKVYIFFFQKQLFERRNLDRPADADKGACGFVSV